MCDSIRRRPRRVPVTLHLYLCFRPSTIHHKFLGEAATVLQAGPVLVDILKRCRVRRVLLSKILRAVSIADIAGVAAAVNQARLLQGRDSIALHRVMHQVGPNRPLTFI